MPPPELPILVVFMADRWKPENPIEGQYIWLPILFEGYNIILKWIDSWDLDIFKE